VGLEPVLTGIEGLEFVHLGRRDVVRHRIVGDIVEAYERSTARAPGSGATPSPQGADPSGVVPANGSRPIDDAGDVAGATPAGDSSGGFVEP
jgi:hypothetical protein